MRRFKIKSKFLLIPSALAVLFALTACSDNGTVKEIRWHEDSLGNKTCDLLIRPDDMDSAAYWVTNRRKNQCDQCPPPSARWPSCAMPKETTPGREEGGNERPDPPEHTIPWNPGGGGGNETDRPVRRRGDACLVDGAPAQTETGVPMRCRDGTWQIS